MGEKKTKVTLEEIARDEARGKHLLGIAAGMDIGHCSYLGSRHCSEKDFLRSVRYYRHCDAGEFPEMGSHCATVVAFYKDKQDGGIEK